MQSQLVCSGCRSVLLYPRGAANVCCAICNTITPGMEMSHLVCGGCRTLLMYSHGAASVRCACCQTINFARTAHPFAQVNCAQCHTTLMYPSGAPSVKCAVCCYVTNVGMSNMSTPIPVERPNGTPLPSMLSTSAAQTILVENPTTVDKGGKMVSNIVVGVTTDKK